MADVEEEMSECDHDLFIEMLLKLDGTHESVKAASKWCRSNAKHNDVIVKTWFWALAKARTMSRRLDLFHLASDILFTADHQSLPFFCSFLPILVKAIPLVRGEEIKLSMVKLLSLWREKNIYNEAVMDEFVKSLRNKNKVVPDDVFYYDQEALFTNSARIHKLKPAIDYLRLEVDHSPTFDNIQHLLGNIKDRRTCASLFRAVDNQKKRVKTLVDFLEEMVHLLKWTTVDLDMAANKQQNGVETVKLKLMGYQRFGEKVRSVQHTLISVHHVPPPAIKSPSPEKEADVESLFSRRPTLLNSADPRGGPRPVLQTEVLSPLVGSLTPSREANYFEPTLNTAAPRGGFFTPAVSIINPLFGPQMLPVGSLTPARDSYEPPIGSTTPTLDEVVLRSVEPRRYSYPSGLDTSRHDSWGTIGSTSHVADNIDANSGSMTPRSDHFNLSSGSLTTRGENYVGLGYVASPGDSYMISASRRDSYPVSTGSMTPRRDSIERLPGSTTPGRNDFDASWESVSFSGPSSVPVAADPRTRRSMSAYSLATNLDYPPGSSVSKHDSFSSLPRTRRPPLLPTPDLYDLPAINRDREITPARERARTPSRERARTPGRERARTPGRERARTPGRERAMTPGRERAITPGRDRAMTPGRDSSFRERAMTPGRDSSYRERTMTPSRDSSFRGRAMTPGRDSSFRGRAVTPSRDSSLENRTRAMTPGRDRSTESDRAMTPGRDTSFRERAMTPGRDSLFRERSMTPGRDLPFRGRAVTPGRDSSLENRIRAMTPGRDTSFRERAMTPGRDTSFRGRSMTPGRDSSFRGRAVTPGKESSFRGRAMTPGRDSSFRGRAVTPGRDSSLQDRTLAMTPGRDLSTESDRARTSGRDSSFRERAITPGRDSSFRGRSVTPGRDSSFRGRAVTPGRDSSFRGRAMTPGRDSSYQNRTRAMTPGRDLSTESDKAKTPGRDSSLKERAMTPGRDSFSRGRAVVTPGRDSSLENETQGTTPGRDLLTESDKPMTPDRDSSPRGRTVTPVSDSVLLSRTAATTPGRDLPTESDKALTPDLAKEQTPGKDCPTQNRSHAITPKRDSDELSGKDPSATSDKASCVEEHTPQRDSPIQDKTQAVTPGTDKAMTPGEVLASTEGRDQGKTPIKSSPLKSNKADCSKAPESDVSLPDNKGQGTPSEEPGGSGGPESGNDNSTKLKKDPTTTMGKYSGKPPGREKSLPPNRNLFRPPGKEFSRNQARNRSMTPGRDTGLDSLMDVTTSAPRNSRGHPRTCGTLVHGRGNKWPQMSQEKRRGNSNDNYNWKRMGSTQGPSDVQRGPNSTNRGRNRGGLDSQQGHYQARPNFQQGADSGNIGSVHGCEQLMSDTTQNRRSRPRARVCRKTSMDSNRQDSLNSPWDPFTEQNTRPSGPSRRNSFNQESDNPAVSIFEQLRAKLTETVRTLTPSGSSLNSPSYSGSMSPRSDRSYSPAGRSMSPRSDGSYSPGRRSTSPWGSAWGSGRQNQGGPVYQSKYTGISFDNSSAASSPRVNSGQRAQSQPRNNSLRGAPRSRPSFMRFKPSGYRE